MSGMAGIRTEGHPAAKPGKDGPASFNEPASWCFDVEQNMRWKPQARQRCAIPWPRVAKHEPPWESAKQKKDGL